MTGEDPEVGGGAGPSVAGAEADVIDGGGPILDGGGGGDDSSSSIPNDAATNSESTYNNPTAADVASARKKKLLVGGAVVAICLAAIAVGVAVPISRNRREAAAAAASATAQQDQQTQQAQQDDGEGNDTSSSPPDDATKTNASDTDGDGGGGGGIDPETGVVTGPGLDPPSINVANRFNVKVPSFSPYVMQPYDACDDLIDDVELALKLLADQVIERNKDMECYGHFYDGPMWAESAMGGGAQPEMMATTAVMDTATATTAAKNEPASAPPPDTAGDAANDESYGTNNQVEGVDEADVVKSDGTYIFAAYGSDLVMMDLDGNVVDRLAVPDPPEEETEEERAQDEDEDAISGGFVGGMDVIGIYPPIRYKPQRTIKSLLLDSDRGVITAITHYEHSWNYRERNIVSGGVTTAYVFNYATEELISLGEVDLPGRYASARSIESSAHVVTGSYIDTSGFTRKLDRCSVEYDDMDSTEYEMAAFQTARATVSEFARELVEELRWAGDSCDHIVRISSYEEPATEADDEVSTSTLRRLDLTDGRGILNGFVQISSFDTSLDGVEKLSSGEGVNVAGAFVPTSSAPTSETYASEDFIVLAGRGYRQDPTDESWSQHTFLMSFALDGPRAVQSAVGEAPGYLLNQFSMDYHDGIFRVATTNRVRWGVTVDEKTGDRRWEIQSVSSSQVTKFKFENGLMREVGQLEGLGRTEQITSCRFVRDRAYVVTFQLKDPLYVIDMVPDVPEVLGELNVTGFSSYIHPIGEDQELLLTVGQEADPKTGWATGMKVSLFDVSDPTDPTEIQKYVASEDGGSSSSAAQWDHHAFRYLDASGKLILPLWRYRYRSRDNFDGFVIYDVDPDAPRGEGIRPLGNVTHADYDEINNVRGLWCFGRANLPPRSMVFSGGDLVTFKGHSIKMSRNYLVKLEGNGGVEEDDGGASGGGWTKNLDEGRVEGEDVCYDYFFW